MIDGRHEVQGKPPERRGSREFVVWPWELPADSVGDEEVRDEL